MMLRTCVLCALLVLAPGCAKPPIYLSAQAQAAWRGTRIIHALDVIRDIAIDANASDPPLLNEATTRQVVLVHKSLITIVHEQPAGWQGMVLAGLDGLESLLPAGDMSRLLPYIHIARAALKEF
jgi:hypothetical protein